MPEFDLQKEFNKLQTQCKKELDQQTFNTLTAQLLHERNHDIRKKITTFLKDISERNHYHRIALMFETSPELELPINHADIIVDGKSKHPGCWYSFLSDENEFALEPFVIKLECDNYCSFLKLWESRNDISQLMKNYRRINEQMALEWKMMGLEEATFFNLHEVFKQNAPDILEEYYKAFGIPKAFDDPQKEEQFEEKISDVLNKYRNHWLNLLDKWILLKARVKR